MTQNVSLTCTAVNNLKISRRRTAAILKIEKSASSHDDAERVHLESLKLNFFNGRCTWEMFCIIVPNFAERHHTLRYTHCTYFRIYGWRHVRRWPDWPCTGQHGTGGGVWYLRLSCRPIFLCGRWMTVCWNADAGVQWERAGRIEEQAELWRMWCGIRHDV